VDGNNRLADKTLVTEKRPEVKKGAGASPLFLIDAPKPVTESRIGSGHPGKPIFCVTNQRANHMPAGVVPSGTLRGH
jgi:hypothetical protein